MWYLLRTSSESSLKVIFRRLVICRGGVFGSKILKVWAVLHLKRLAKLDLLELKQSE